MLVTSCLCGFPWSAAAARSRVHTRLHVPLRNIVPLPHHTPCTAGFEHYEVSNYALPGHRCRHNMAYWEGAAFYGLGLGSASHLQAGRLLCRSRHCYCCCCCCRGLCRYLKLPQGCLLLKCPPACHLPSTSCLLNFRSPRPTPPRCAVGPPVQPAQAAECLPGVAQAVCSRCRTGGRRGRRSRRLAA